MMEQTGEAHHNKNNSSGNELPACGLHSKRLKELENAALQTTLISRMETESGADGGSWTEQEPGEGEQSNVLSLNHRSGPPQQPGADTETEEAEPDRNVAKERVEEERTLTDHLNKRLLSSFLEKLNERDLALPGVQRLDCAVADEDSNRAADEWWRNPVAHATTWRRLRDSGQTCTEAQPHRFKDWTPQSFLPAYRSVTKYVYFCKATMDERLI